MRKSQLTASEIEAAEQASDKRKRDRRNGFSLMDVRDRGWARLSTGQLVEWHVDAPLEEGVARTHVPPGCILIDGSLFNSDEFQRYLRWA